MLSDIDTWGSAHLPIMQYGEMATLEAAQRADTLLDRGDMDGCRVWSGSSG
jgi:hypothetical protein